MNELAKSIAELIGTISGGAKGAGEALQRITPDAWAIAVRQARIDAWSSLVCCLCVSALMVAGAHVLANARDKYAAKAKEHKEHGCGYEAEQADEGASATNGARLALIFVAALVAIVGVCENVDKAINPEYEAASQLAERFLCR